MDTGPWKDPDHQQLPKLPPKVKNSQHSHSKPFITYSSSPPHPSENLPAQTHNSARPNSLLSLSFFNSIHHFLCNRESSTWMNTSTQGHPFLSTFSAARLCLCSVFALKPVLATQLKGLSLEGLWSGVCLWRVFIRLFGSSLWGFRLSEGSVPWPFWMELGPSVTASLRLLALAVGDWFHWREVKLRVNSVASSLKELFTEEGVLAKRRGSSANLGICVTW